MRVESSGSENALTDQYGLITDYLAEAFHYQLKHSNLR
jgi:predicted ATP-dependent Lon-type protease